MILAQRLAIDVVAAFLVVLLLDAARAYNVRAAEARDRWVAQGFKWLFAPLVEAWVGLSLTRFIAVWIAIGTVDLAHDWVDSKLPLGWPFVTLVLGGFLLAVVTALGAKHIDRLIDMIGHVLSSRYGGGLGTPGVARTPAGPAAVASPSDPDLRP